MKDYELIAKYNATVSRLNDEGYKVSAVNTAFFVHNNKGTIVADVQTIEGLYGFLQGIQWANEANSTGAK